jgi:hypothetical protein
LEALDRAVVGIPLTTACLLHSRLSKNAQPTHTHPEYGKCNVCRNVGKIYSTLFIPESPKTTKTMFMILKQLSFSFQQNDYVCLSFNVQATNDDEITESHY